MNDTPFLLPTSDEVTRRLRIVAELRNLCLSLGQARKMEESSDPRSNAISPEPTPGIASGVSFR